MLENTLARNLPIFVCRSKSQCGQDRKPIGSASADTPLKAEEGIRTREYKKAHAKMSSEMNHFGMI